MIGTYLYALTAKTFGPSLLAHSLIHLSSHLLPMRYKLAYKSTWLLKCLISSFLIKYNNKKVQTHTVAKGKKERKQSWMKTTKIE